MQKTINGIVVEFGERTGVRCAAFIDALSAVGGDDDGEAVPP